MKRGQLAAVIVIVLLVAAVGGFVVFSAKKAGRAVTLSASSGQQQGQNIMAIPIPPGFQPGPLKPPAQPIPPSQPGPPGSGAQPQPPAPKPPAPGAGGGTTTTEAEEPVCPEGMMRIYCQCHISSKGASGSCNEQMDLKGFVKGDGDPPYHYEGIGWGEGLDIYPHGPDKGSSWNCNSFRYEWKTYVFVPGFLCGIQHIQDRHKACADRCKEEAKSKKTKQAALDKATEDCVKDAQHRCPAGFYRNVVLPETPGGRETER